MNVRLLTFPAILLALLAGCGGGNDASQTTTPPARQRSAAALLSAAEPLPPGVPESYMRRCVKPLDPFDRQGTLQDEMSFLRLWAEETYLWNKEIPAVRMADYGSAIDYFHALKTPALTPSGRAKDRYHYTYPEKEYEELEQGISLGYGLTWVRNAGYPRNWLVAHVEPGSAAAAAGIRRGAKLLGVDGVDFEYANTQAQIDRINAGLFPKVAGQRHALRLGLGLVRKDVVLESAKITADPVGNVQVIETAAGKVGYMLFSSHNDISEQRLIDGFTKLRDAGVSGLVLDLRYNGGGLVSIASEVGYMIAGPARALGKTFELTTTNNPNAVRSPQLFTSKALGMVKGQPTPRGTPLPYLDLGKVTVIAGPGTCSASESIINGLRGIDVEVELVGSTTCGKPYAFLPTANCGTYYFMIQFQGVNAKGWGDYGDGFAPTCQVRDNVVYALGDPRENLLKAALHRNTTGLCPVPPGGLPAGRTRSAAPVPGQAPAAQDELVPVRPEVTELKILR
jgi:hypothetical protein